MCHAEEMNWKKYTS